MSIATRFDAAVECCWSIIEVCAPWSEMAHPRMPKASVIDHRFEPEANGRNSLDGDSVPKPLGFIAFAPEWQPGLRSGSRRSEPFRPLSRRSGRIPALPYP